MPALIAILKWVGVNVLLPVLLKMWEGWQKSREKAAALKAKLSANRKKGQAHEENSTDSSYSELP